MNDTWNRIGKLAAQGGKQAMIQVKKWGKQVSVQVRLWQIGQERQEIFAKIGELCWEKYPQEAEPLFSDFFSKLCALREEEQKMKGENRQGKDGEGG